MPLARVATAVVEGRTHPCCTSERNTRSRAASIPGFVGQRENSETALSRKQGFSLMDVKDVPPSSLPGVMIARGRKCDLSRVTSQPDYMADTPASVTQEIPDASGQCPRKRHKGSASTPAAPRSSQPTRLQSRRLSRPRIGSPTINPDFVWSSRGSTRLSRKVHPFIDSRGPDIYTHLADPGDAGNLLSGPPAGSVVLSTPSEMVGSLSVKKSRRRQRKTSDLTNDNAKRDLIEEWAWLRQSQGTLPLSGISANACFSQTLLHGNQKNGSVSSMQFEATTRESSPGADPAKRQATAIVGIPRSRQTIDMDFDSALPVGTNVPEAKLDYEDSILSPDGGAERPMTPSTFLSEYQMDEDSHTDRPAGAPETTLHTNLLQCPPSSLSPRSSRVDPVLTSRTQSTKSPLGEQAEVVGLNSPSKDSHSVTSPLMCPFDLDSDVEFCMLDIPEIFTLPWAPVSSHQLYVPPGLGKLVSGMRERLAMEARARRRAEELYQAEMRRRVSAEKAIEDLRTELEKQI